MRRAILVILLAAFSTTRVVTFGHAHAGHDTPIDHDARCHVHVHHHDHHESDEHHHEFNDVDDGHSLGIGSAREHDSDAIYLDDVVVVRDTQRQEGTKAVSLSSTMSAVAVRRCETNPALSLHVLERPPDRLHSGPPLFLRNLSLRI